MQNINNESDFEHHIRSIIQKSIIEKDKDLILFESKKAVDILICRNGDSPTAKFLEIKYHKNNHNRLGFGQANGAGFQPEILIRRPDFFENNLRWILGSEDSELYYFLNSQALSMFLNKGNVGTKYNGIQKRLFKDLEGINKQELISELKDWLK